MINGDSKNATLPSATAIVLLLAVSILSACGSEPDQASAPNEAGSSPISRETAVNRGEEQIRRGNGGPDPAEPHNAVARLVRWSAFKPWSESAPAGWIAQGYGEPDPNDSVWVVQMETEWPETTPDVAGDFVFAVVVLDAVTGLQSFGIWGPEPYILPGDYFDPEKHLGPLRYVVETSKITHGEAIQTIYALGQDLSPVTPLRGRPDFNRARAEQVRLSGSNNLGWLLTLPYEVGFHQQAGPPAATGEYPSRPIEWANVLFAFLNGSTGEVQSGGTVRSIGPKVSRGESSTLFEHGRELGWWRLWNELRDVPSDEPITRELMTRLARESVTATAPTPTPVPSALENTANHAAYPLTLDAVVGRVSHRIGEVMLQDPKIPGFNLFSYWVIEVDEHFLGQTPTGEVIVVVNDGDANTEGVKFRGSRFPVTLEVGDEVIAFLRQQPQSWPPLIGPPGTSTRAIATSPGMNGLLTVNDGKVSVILDGEKLELTVSEFIEAAMRAGRLAGKPVGRVVPDPIIPTPVPGSGESTAADLRSAIETLPDRAYIELAAGVFAVIPGLFDLVPPELDPADGTHFTVYHVPSGSRVWFYEPDDPAGRSYRSIEAIEALESVIRDPAIIARLRDRAPAN